MRRLREFAIILAITFGLLEVGARILTSTPRGPMIFGQALLPLVPEESAARAWVQQRQTATYLVPDPLLGWVVRPSTAAHGYATNAQGVRTVPADRIYATVPEPGKVRIATFGDSFTHCDEVTNEQTWQHLLEVSDPRLEVMNYGVPGYGSDQAELRQEREIGNAHPHISVLGILVENICRNLNIFRFHLVPTGGLSTKPRFALEDGRLQLIEGAALTDEDVVRAHVDPLSQPLLTKDYWFDPYAVTSYPWRYSRALASVDTMYFAWRRARKRRELYTYQAPEGIDLTVAISKAFAKTARAHGSHPIVVMMPMRDFLDTLHAGPGTFPLVGHLEAAGLEVIDLGPYFSRLVRERGLSEFFLPSGHFTPAGNEAFAREFGVRLGPRVEAVAKALAATSTSTATGPAP